MNPSEKMEADLHKIIDSAMIPIAEYLRSQNLKFVVGIYAEDEDLCVGEVEISGMPADISKLCGYITHSGIEQAHHQCGDYEEEDPKPWKK